MWFSKSLRIIALCMFVSCMLTNNAISKGTSGSSRSAHPFGLIFTGHGDPSPSGVGVNAALNLGGLMRLEAGMGAYNQWFNPADWAIGTYNWTLRPLLVGIAYVFASPFVKNKKRFFYKMFRGMAIDY